MKRPRHAPIPQDTPPLVPLPASPSGTGTLARSGGSAAAAFGFLFLSWVVTTIASSVGNENPNGFLEDVVAHLRWSCCGLVWFLLQRRAFGRENSKGLTAKRSKRTKRSVKDPCAELLLLLSELSLSESFFLTFFLSSLLSESSFSSFFLAFFLSESSDSSLKTRPVGLTWDNTSTQNHISKVFNEWWFLVGHCWIP